MSTSEKKTITLQSSEGAKFEIEEDVAMQMQTIKHMIEDNCVAGVIPLPNVRSKIISKVIKYCKKQVNKDHANSCTKTKKAFKDEYMKTDIHVVIDITMAANYLNIPSLMDLSAQVVADRIKDNTVEELRKIFTVENDYTPEEEEALRKDSRWVFEK